MLDFATLYPSRFLQSADLQGKPDATVTIKKVVVEELGEDKKPKVVITFEDAKKEFVVCRTNAESIALMHGRDVEKWPGHKITLFAKDGAGFAGDGAAIRVRGSPEITEKKSATIQRGRKIIRVDVIPTPAVAKP